MKKKSPLKENGITSSISNYSVGSIVSNKGFKMKSPPISKAGMFTKTPQPTWMPARYATAGCRKTGTCNKMITGFELGKPKQQRVGVETKTKLKFHQESAVSTIGYGLANNLIDGDASVPGTPVIRVPLEEGVLGEANMDGSIYLSDNIEPDSFEERQIINHEMRHATDIRIGKLEYADDYIRWNGETFTRETRNGKDMIKVDGKWKEAGHGGFPWENKANNGN